ncbi:MAG: hypothetical protein Q4F30_02855 [Akkermansia sp.]|nr:hypothetical protein [Akkermansia sp.]
MDMREKKRCSLSVQATGSTSIGLISKCMETQGGRQDAAGKIDMG